MNMTSHTEVTQGLEHASQKNEKEIVIEFGIDRILQFAVYVLSFLAVIAKISELAGQNVSCYSSIGKPIPNNVIAYAASYCWESSDDESSNPPENFSFPLNSSCSIKKDLLKHPSRLKILIQLTPYVTLVEVLLLSIPLVWWHYRVGGRLTGHIKFIKLLLEDIFKEMSEEHGTLKYEENDAYDKVSRYLDGWKAFSLPPKRNDDSEQGTSSSIRKRTSSSTSAEENPILQKSSQNPQNERETKRQNQKWSFLYGSLLDRHIFSMLCYENFSSLEYQPYIISVYKITQVDESISRTEATFLNKLRGILRLHCHEENFGGRFLVKNYVTKHIIGAVVSFLFITGSLVLLTQLEWKSESFRCFLLHQDELCMICTIRRIRDALAYLCVNFVINLFYFVACVWQWYTVTRVSLDSPSCSYFQDINDYGTLALH